MYFPWLLSSSSSLNHCNEQTCLFTRGVFLLVVIDVVAVVKLADGETIFTNSLKVRNVIASYELSTLLTLHNCVIS